MMLTKKLPEAEFAVMKAVWSLPSPVTAPEVLIALSGTEKEWKPQTVVTLLTRLEKKGFLRSEKPGKEREFMAAITEEAYLHFETRQFLEKFDGRSMSAFVSALADEKGLTNQEANELMDWLDRQ